MVKTIVGFIIAGTIFAFLSALLDARMGAAQAQTRRFDLKVQAPIAVEVLSSGTIAILESKGGLKVLRPGSSELVPVKETLGFYSPIDMTSRADGAHETILVSMYWAAAAQTSQMVSGVIAEYDLDGTQLHDWHFPGHVFRGMTIDPSNQIMYLTDGTSLSIYKLDLKAALGKIQPEFFAHVAGASLLGPIALDAASGTVFVGDLEQGNIYSVSVSDHRSRRLVSSLGVPAGLAFDKTSHRLLIADAAKKCVWQVDVNAVGPVPVRLPKGPEFREPRGVAVSAGPKVWVADFQLNKIFVLSPSGTFTAY